MWLLWLLWLVLPNRQQDGNTTCLLFFYLYQMDMIFIPHRHLLKCPTLYSYSLFF